MAIKKYKPTTPGRRQMTGYSFDELTSKKPLKALVKGARKSGGRGNRGNITCRHRGGGVSRKHRDVDFKRNKFLNIPGKVTTVEYDPFRSAYIMLVTYANGAKVYHLAPAKIKVGQTVMFSEKATIETGNRIQLKHIPAGFEIFNIELFPNKGGETVRSAGTSAKVIGSDENYVQVQLPSKEVRLILSSCYATIGRVSNVDHNLITIGKAGRKRKMGRRPQVRGKAMNPNDHPHGGGEGGSPIGLKHPKTPSGLPALGRKTRKRSKSNRLIVRNRKGKLVVKK